MIDKMPQLNYIKLKAEITRIETRKIPVTDYCDYCKKLCECGMNRTYFYFDNIKCSCHSPQHFEMSHHCEDCFPKPPTETKITLPVINLAIEGGS